MLQESDISLELRPIVIEDAPFLFELMNTEDWKHFIGDRNIASISDAEAYIRNRMLPQFNRIGHGNEVIINKETQRPMGTIGLFFRKETDTVPDIGFSILPQYYRRGITFKAGKIILKKAFTQYQLESVYAFTTQDNTASQGLIEKLGMTYVGEEALPDDPLPLRKYLLKKSDWLQCQY
jgi:ribosomal-protein-alanine N-acetyltransferase